MFLDLDEIKTSGETNVNQGLGKLLLIKIIFNVILS